MLRIFPSIIINDEVVIEIHKKVIVNILITRIRYKKGKFKV